MQRCRDFRHFNRQVSSVCDTRVESSFVFRRGASSKNATVRLEKAGFRNFDGGRVIRLTRSVSEEIRDAVKRQLERLTEFVNWQLAGHCYPQNRVGCLTRMAVQGTRRGCDKRMGMAKFDPPKSFRTANVTPTTLPC